MEYLQLNSNGGFMKLFSGIFVILVLIPFVIYGLLQIFFKRDWQRLKGVKMRW